MKVPQPFLAYASIVHCLAFGTTLLSADEPTGRTSLTNSAIKYQVSGKPFAILKQGKVTAVVIDNSAVNNETLDDHNRVAHTKSQEAV